MNENNATVGGRYRRIESVAKERYEIHQWRNENNIATNNKDGMITTVEGSFHFLLRASS
jgi:hypothetical protein